MAGKLSVLGDTRVFNGKRYQLKGTRLYKAKAEEWVESLRARGFLARIVRGKSMDPRQYPCYYVYARKP